MAEILKASVSSYDQAITLLRAGAPVALPTETVYGLAALATDDEAVASLYKIKSRPRSKPFSIVVSSVKSAEKIARFSPLALQLAKAFWPGPLTLILPLKKLANISPLALGDDGTIGLRCPDIPWMEYFGQSGFNVPLVLPSANTSGKPAPTAAHAVQRDLGDKISVIIDSGDCKTGTESTILTIEGNRARIIRMGALRPEALAPFHIDWIT